MKLHAKIKSKYLDQLLSGEKVYEYRQFESLTLTDENGRSEEFQVGYVGIVESNQHLQSIKDEYRDVNWIEEAHIIEMKLWKKESNEVYHGEG